MTELAKVVSYLDDYLSIRAIPDDPRALNGLQVEGTRSVRRIVAAVDASVATIDGAIGLDADLILVHHGLFWGGSEPVVGRNAKRLRPLLTHGVSLYSAHLPLDCHPVVGNNALLAGQLGMADQRPFGDYRGVAIGVAGTLDSTLEGLVERLHGILNVTPKAIAGGPGIRRAGRVGVVTGSGGSFIRQTKEAGLDTLVTGEGAHHNFLDAEEYGINVILAGHYATETLGVQALAAHLADWFDATWQFVDHPSGL